MFNDFYELDFMDDVNEPLIPTDGGKCRAASEAINLLKKYIIPRRGPMKLKTAGQYFMGLCEVPCLRR